MISEAKKKEVARKLDEIANTVVETITVGSLAKAALVNSKELLESNDSLMPVLRTALVINWREEGMKKRYRRFRSIYPEIFNLARLKTAIDTTDALTFCKDYLDINSNLPESNPKYALLKDLTDAFLDYQAQERFPSEMAAMRDWAERFEGCDLKEDPIGKIRGVGPAVVENIRLNLGYSVVKPDRHVVRVMNEDLGLKEISTENYNEFATFIGVDRRYLDSLLFRIGKTKKLSARKTRKIRN